MLTAFLRAIGQLTDPPILRVLGASVMLSIACFAAAWFGIGWLLVSIHLWDVPGLDTAIAVLGGFATLILSWLLFPLLVSTFVGLFLDRVATTVEAKHYRGLPPAKGLPWWQGLWCSARFLGLVLVMNVLLLLLLFVPPLYPVGYVVVNGMLIGREYFDLVALRRVDPASAKTLRKRCGFDVFVMGAIGAALAMIPLANFVAPILLTAAMVHRFEAARTQAGGG
jgi:CysZ protein